MKFILKTLVYFLFFIFSLLIFLPKEQFYYFLEKQLSTKSIIVSNEIVDEKLFGINIKDAQLYYDGINFALVNNIDMTTFLFYNSVNFDSLRVSKSFSNFLPSNIDNLKLKYSILDFSSIKILSKGDFGEFEGKISIFDNKIIGELKPSNIMKTKYSNLLRRFKKVNGKYIYEFRF